MTTCRIGSRLGGGGMGEVLLGRWRDRTVAIKRMHAQLAEDPSRRAMFLDEARLAARIRHPNVVPTLDVVDEGTSPLIVMEYADGATLASLLAACRRAGEAVPLGVAIRIACDVLDGLHAAHETTTEDGRPLDIVHRDVSPQNVIVGRDGIARVIDFGIARARERSVDTKTGEVKGKLAYMPPEQFRGRGVDRRADVYAAAAVLWECLTARRFRAGSDAEVLEQILVNDVDAPSRFADVPPALDDVVLRALATSPSRRFETADAMARALREATPPATRDEVARFVERAAREDLAARAAILDGDRASSAPRRGRALRVAAAIAVAAIALAGGAALAARGPKQGAPPAARAAVVTVLTATNAEPSPPPAFSGPSASAATPRPARRTVVRKAAAAGNDPCAVPFVIDADGDRKYKRECLR